MIRLYTKSHTSLLDILLPRSSTYVYNCKIIVNSRGTDWTMGQPSCRSGYVLES